MLVFFECKVSRWEYYRMLESLPETDLVATVECHQEKQRSFASWIAHNSWQFQVLYIDFLADRSTGFWTVANYNSLYMCSSFSYEHHSLIISTFCTRILYLSLLRSPKNSFFHSQLYLAKFLDYSQAWFVMVIPFDGLRAWNRVGVRFSFPTNSHPCLVLKKILTSRASLLFYSKLFDSCRKGVRLLDHGRVRTYLYIQFLHPYLLCTFEWCSSPRRCHIR